MKKLTVNGGQPAPTLMEMVKSIIEAKSRKGDDPPLEALTFAMQWLYARKLKGEKLTVRINDWIKRGPVTKEKVVNFIQSHEMDAAIVAPLAISALTQLKVDHDTNVL